jgi:hypothetical protein
VSGRPSVLLAPVTVTPTKPLTPSHLKGLLWADAMARSTAGLADVTFRYSHTTYHLTEQTLGFWEFLDRTRGDLDWSGRSEEEIGGYYVEYRADPGRPPAAALRPYADAVEQGWVHPSSARVLELWAGHYTRMGLRDPGLLTHQPPGLSLAQTVERLADAGLALDQRRYGGPVLLDVTAHGLPLRRIVSPDGRPNYLACALRELLPLAARHEETVLLYDRELDSDYRLLEHVLRALGATVSLVPIGRVPIDGRIASTRHGGWAGHTARALLNAAGEAHDPAALRLGLRLYFIAVLGPGQQQSFRADLMHQCMTRAQRLLAAAGASPGATPGAAAGTVAGAPAGTAPRTVAETAAETAAAAAPEPDPARLLSCRRPPHLHVDPYRLTASLMGRRRPPPDRGLLTAVYL